jgi:hypothetical protein
MTRISLTEDDRNVAKGKKRAAKGKEKATDSEDPNEERSKSIWDLVDDRVPIKQSSAGNDSEFDASIQPNDTYRWPEKAADIREWVWDCIDHPNAMKPPPKGSYSYLLAHAQAVPEAGYVAQEIATKILESEKHAFKCVAHARGDKETKKWDSDKEFLGIPWEPFPTTLKNLLREEMQPSDPSKVPKSFEEARQVPRIAELIQKENTKRGNKAGYGSTLKFNSGPTLASISSSSGTVTSTSGHGHPELDRYGRDIRSMDCGCETRRGLGGLAFWKMGRLGSATHPGLRSGGDSDYLPVRDRDMFLEAMESLGKVHLEDLYTHVLENDPQNPDMLRFRRKNPLERLCKQAYRVFADIRLLSSHGHPIPPGYEALGRFLEENKGDIETVKPKVVEEEEEEPMTLLNEEQREYLEACAENIKKSHVK